MSRPKGSKNKPKVAKVSEKLEKVAESAKSATEAIAQIGQVIKKGKGKKGKNTSSAVAVSQSVIPVEQIQEVKADYTALRNLVKAVYDTMPQEQQLRWQQPSDDATLQTPEDKITAVLVTYFGLDKAKITNLNK